MKLATYDDGSRDGQLVVVSSDLSLAHYASDIASRLQQVLDDWNFLSPQLEDLARTLNHGKARHAFAFEPRRCKAPLPRAYQRMTGLAPPRVDTGSAVQGPDVEPLLRQACSDPLLGPHDDIVATSEADEIDFGAQLAAITADVRRGCGTATAIESVRLLVLAGETRLLNRVADETGADFEPHQNPLGCALAPVAVTPDELGPAWHAGRARLTLECFVNAQPLGQHDTDAAMPYHFGELIAHLCRRCSLGAGSIVGADCGRIGEPTSQAAGSATRSTVQPAARTPAGDPRTTNFLMVGDTIRIEACDATGASVFGAIEQRVCSAKPAADR
jgi:fumarylacetoacetate (FAA) hydrolase